MPKLVCVALCALLVVGCTSGTRQATTAVVEPATTSTARSDYQPAPTARSARPPYCDYYDQWARADGDMKRIEARQPSTNVNDWPRNDYDAWLDAVSRTTEWSGRLWRAAGSDATWVSVRKACR